MCIKILFALQLLADMDLDAELPVFNLPSTETGTDTEMYSVNIIPSPPRSTSTPCPQVTPSVTPLPETSNRKTPKKSKKNHDQITDSLMYAALNSLESEPPAVSHNGQSIAEELETVSADQRAIAKKLIRDVLFYASFNNSTINSTVNC